MRRVLILTAAVLATFAIVPVADAGGPQAPAHKLDRALQHALTQGDQQQLRVIMQTAPGTGVAVTEAVRRKGRRADQVGSSTDLLSMTVSADELAELASRPDVVRVSSDAVVQSHADTTATAQTTSHLLNTLGLANSPWDGTWVGVVVIDSGVASTRHVNWTMGFWDFTLTDELGNALPPKSTKPFDDYGHGTHVAGLIANNGDLAEGVYRGVAPSNTLHAMKVLDREGRGLTSNVIRAIDFAVAQKDKLWIDVINLSLGHPILEPAATDPLVQAVERAVRAGIVVVVSAGNIGRNPETGVVGYAGLTSPGNAPSAITVGAIDTRQTTTRDDDVIPDYSSRGPTWYDGFQKPDLVAPGTQLVANVSTSSLLYLTNPNLVVDSVKVGGDPTPYMRFSGTSMAAAVTTGVVAQMLQAHRESWSRGTGLQGRNVVPRLSPNTVKAILQYTALPMSGYDTLTQGAGAINGEGAVRLATAIDTRAAPGTWWASPTVGTEVSSIGSDTYAWSSCIVWGDRIVWGEQIYYNDPAWSQRIVWGDRIVWGNRVIWGDSLVWSDQAVWADRIVWGNSTIGYTIDGLKIVWGNRIVWGELSADRIVWGNLASVLGLSSTNTAWGSAVR